MSDGFSDLFKRVPTDEEKMHYREAWGGIAPFRVIAAMVFMFGMGVLVGMSL